MKTYWLNTSLLFLSNCCFIQNYFSFHKGNQTEHPIGTMLTLECKEGLSYYPGKPNKTQTLEVVCQGELDTGLARFVKKNSTSPLPYCQKECYSNGDCHPNFSMCSNGKFYLFQFDGFLVHWMLFDELWFQEFVSKTAIIKVPNTLQGNRWHLPAQTEL